MKFYECVSLSTINVNFLGAMTAPFPCIFLNVFIPNFYFYLSLYSSKNEEGRNMKSTSKLIMWDLNCMLTVHTTPVNTL